MNRMRIAAAAAGIAFVSGIAQAEVHKQSWGQTESGQPVDLYTISGVSLTVRLTNYGARVLTIDVPDRAGHQTDVVLGFKDIGGYEDPKNTTYAGAIVGRYGNRIRRGRFSLEGRTYNIPTNDHSNTLHGGTIGFDKKVWQAHMIPNGVEFALTSPHGDMGFPGTLNANVKYTVIGSSLQIDYTATTDKPTVVNLTNHTYFNLGGEDSGTVLNHQMMIAASEITPVDSVLIPTGKRMPVAGTPFDFRQPHTIGQRISANDQQLKCAGGYDHNFILDQSEPGMHLVARAYDPKSSRTLTVTSTEPGVQFYSGNFLDGTLIGRGGTPYAKHAGFCLETQHFPDSPNQPSFPSTELSPDRMFHSTTVYTFGVAK